MANPWDVSGTDAPPANPNASIGDNLSSTVQDPTFWQNLSSFGAGTLAAANARTPQGFLANGAAPWGAIGQGMLTAQQENRLNAKTNADIGLQRAQTADVGMQSQQRQIQNQIALSNLKFNQMYDNIQPDQAPMPGQSQVAPDASGPPPGYVSDPTLPRPIRTHNPTSLTYAPGQPGVLGPDGGQGIQLGVYSTPVDGIAAAVNQLKQYAAKGINTPLDIATKWGPAGDPNYGPQTASFTGLDPNKPIDINNPQHVTAMLNGIVRAETSGSVLPDVMQAGIAKGMQLNPGTPSQRADANVASGISSNPAVMQQAQAYTPYQSMVLLKQFETGALPNPNTAQALAMLPLAQRRAASGMMAQHLVDGLADLAMKPQTNTATINQALPINVEEARQKANNQASANVAEAGAKLPIEEGLDTFKTNNAIRKDQSGTIVGRDGTIYRPDPSNPNRLVAIRQPQIEHTIDPKTGKGTYTAIDQIPQMSVTEMPVASSNAPNTEAQPVPQPASTGGMRINTGLGISNAPTQINRLSRSNGMPVAATTAPVTTAATQNNTPAPGSIIAKPVTDGQGNPVIRELSPGEAKGQEEQSDILAKKGQQYLKEQSDGLAANAQMDLANQLMANIKPGAGTEAYAKIGSYVLRATQLAGYANPDLERSVGTVQALNNLAGQQIRTDLHEIGARSNMEYVATEHSLANQPENNIYGARIGAAQVQGLTDWKIARAASYAHNTGNNSNNSKDFESNFNSQYSPYPFVVNRLLQTPEGADFTRGMVQRMYAGGQGKEADQLKADIARIHTDFAKTPGIAGIPAPQPPVSPQSMTPLQ